MEYFRTRVVIFTHSEVKSYENAISKTYIVKGAYENIKNENESFSLNQKTFNLYVSALNIN